MSEVIDHVGIRVSDLAASRRMYEAALAELGFEVLSEGEFEGDTYVLFGRGAGDDFSLHTVGSEPGRDRVTTGAHIAFRAGDASAVGRWHDAAVTHGGTDNGPPGVRPEYSGHYYAAFVLDPDGNNVEAVFHASADSLNDPELVRKAYADEKRYATRMAKQETATGPDPYDVVFAAVAERQPRDVLEVGCGRGELAERMSRELPAHVTALDQSARMVELTAARGVETIIGDVVDLPFRDRSFDCAVAAWMLYHASDLDRALAELRRVLRRDGRLVAATSSERNLAEVWELVGAIGAPGGGFTIERAGGALRRHFSRVEQRDVLGTVTFDDPEAAYEYVAATRAELADLLPDLDGPLVATRRLAVFVCAP